MKVLGSSVLAFEIVIILLAIPVALWSNDNTGLVVAAALIIAVGLVVALVGLRRGWGLTVGWVMQAALIAYGLLAAWMFVIGVIFTILWWAAIHYGSRVDAMRQRQG